MGSNQQLERLIIAIRKHSGIRLADGNYLVSEPILCGRDEGKLKNSLTHTEF